MSDGDVHPMLAEADASAEGSAHGERYVWTVVCCSWLAILLTDNFQRVSFLLAMDRCRNM